MLGLDLILLPMHRGSKQGGRWTTGTGSVGVVLQEVQTTWWLPVITNTLRLNRKKMTEKRGTFHSPKNKP